MWEARTKGKAVAKTCYKELAELYEERLRERGLTITGITIHRIEGDKIVEEWEMPDLLGLMQQIRAAPSPG